VKRPILQLLPRLPAGLPGRPLAAAAVAAAAVWAYAPALTGGFLWDDALFVTENPLIRGVEGLWRTWSRPGEAPQYYPVTHTVFWLEWRFFGLRTFGYHAVNLALHLLNAALVWALLRRWKVLGAGWAAAIFALHPVHVESVAWISELKNVLSTFFFLAAFLSYWDYRERRRRPGAWRPYLAALALFAAALGSKTVTCVWPVAVLLAVWWKEDRNWLKELRPLAPFFALALADGLLTAWLERTKIGAQGPDWEFSVLQRLEIAGRALWFYAGKLAWPAGLSFVYPRWSLGGGAGLLYAAAFAGVLAALWHRRKKWGRGPLAAVLFFAAALFPALGFFNFYPMLFSFVADHFQYLASLGLIVLAAAAVPRRAQAALGAVAVVLAFLAWDRAKAFAGPEAIWRDALAKNPAAWLAHHNLGYELLVQRRPEEAIPALRQALALRPDYPEADYNLGNALLDAGRLKEAEAQFRDIVRRRPAFAAAHVNLGNTLYRLRRFREAETAYRRALDLRPLPEALAGLGNLLSESGRAAEALPYFEQAARLTPGSPDTLYNLGLCLSRLDRPAQAEEAWSRAAQAGSLEARRALGPIYLRQGRLTEAAEHLRVYLAAHPREPAAWINMGIALARLGDAKGARDAFEQALRLDPKNKTARANLARVMSRHSR
jgi:protein O-mannosyl-transferase